MVSPLSGGVSDNPNGIAMSMFTKLLEKRLWSLATASVAAVCAGLSVLPYCPPAVTCFRAVVHLANPSSAVVGITVLGSIVVGGWSLLTGWTLYRGWRDVNRLSRVPPPRALAAAAQPAGVRRLVRPGPPGPRRWAGAARPAARRSRPLGARRAHPD
mgnify:CR=1 FL=1